MLPQAAPNYRAARRCLSTDCGFVVGPAPSRDILRRRRHHCDRSENQRADRARLDPRCRPAMARFRNCAPLRCRRRTPVETAPSGGRSQASLVRSALTPPAHERVHRNGATAAPALESMVEVNKSLPLPQESHINELARPTTASPPVADSLLNPANELSVEVLALHQPVDRENSWLKALPAKNWWSNRNCSKVTSSADRYSVSRLR